MKPILTDIPVVEHHCYVIRVFQRPASGLWFATVSKDALRTFTSGDYETQADALAAVAGYLGASATISSAPLSPDPGE